MSLMVTVPLEGRMLHNATDIMRYTLDNNDFWLDNRKIDGAGCLRLRPYRLVTSVDLIEREDKDELHTSTLKSTNSSST